MAIKSRGIKIDEEACDVYMVGGGGEGRGGEDLVSAVHKNCNDKKIISICKKTSSLLENSSRM